MGGEGPIFYTALRSYARDNNIAGADFRLFRAFLTVLDMEWLKQADARARRKGQKDGGN